MVTRINNDSLDCKDKRVQINSDVCDLEHEDLLCKIYSLAAFIANESQDMLKDPSIKDCK